MSTRRKYPKKKTPGIIPRFQDMPAFTPEEFTTAFIFANNAASHRAIVTDPSTLGLRLDMGGSEVQEIRFTDIPENRMMAAFKERYGHDAAKFASVCARTMALITIVHRDELAEWVIPHADGPELHDALLDAAAVTRLDQTGNFPLDEYLESVRSFIATKYTEE